MNTVVLTPKTIALALIGLSVALFGLQSIAEGVAESRITMNE